MAGALGNLEMISRGVFCLQFFYFQRSSLGFDAILNSTWENYITIQVVVFQVFEIFSSRKFGQDDCFDSTALRYFIQNQFLALLRNSLHQFGMLQDSQVSANKTPGPPDRSGGDAGFTNLKFMGFSMLFWLKQKRVFLLLDLVCVLFFCFPNLVLRICQVNNCWYEYYIIIYSFQTSQTSGLVIVQPSNFLLPRLFRKGLKNIHPRRLT